MREDQCCTNPEPKLWKLNTDTKICLVYGMFLYMSFGTCTCTHPRIEPNFEVFIYTNTRVQMKTTNCPKPQSSLIAIFSFHGLGSVCLPSRSWMDYALQEAHFSLFQLKMLPVTCKGTFKTVLHAQENRVNGFSYIMD